MSRDGKHLSELIQERVNLFPVSGEINRRLAQPGKVMQCVEQKFAIGEPIIDRTDGLSVEFDTWRFFES